MFSLNTYHSLIDEALNTFSIDTTFSRKFYTDLITTQRELWLRNEYNKNRQIDPDLLQDIPCLEMELSNPIDCCVNVSSDDCLILRTKYELPTTIEFHDAKGITSVGPSDIMSPRYSLINYNRVSFVGNNKYTDKLIYAFLYNRRIYVISKNPLVNLIKKINVRGLFVDPTELGKFKNCQNKPCWTPDDIYPLNGWMWENMLPYIIDKLKNKQSSKIDASNDGTDSTVEQVK